MRDGVKSLYENVLTESGLADACTCAWSRLPAAVRELHSHVESVKYTGRGSVERGTSLLSQMVGAMMRFPTANSNTPVTVEFNIRDGKETWTRHFGSRQFQSTLSARGKYLRESFAFVSILFMLETDANGLRMLPVRWAALGIPLPKILWPGIVAYETEIDGRFHFYVEASMPLIGLVVRYRGELQRGF